MKALRVTKGSSSWTIALEHTGVLNATVNCFDIPDRGEESVELIMGGLDSPTDTHIRWEPIGLTVGDQVTVEVIEDCAGDEPDEIETRDFDQEKERAKQYVRDQAAKLGWTITENEGAG